MLGSSYESGIGVAKDFDIARDCYLKASKLGIKEAEIALSRVNASSEVKANKSCVKTPLKAQEESKVVAIVNHEPPVRLAYINTQRLFKELKTSNDESKDEDARILERANKIVKSIAEKYELSIVMQDVVWIDSSFDITSFLISIMNNNSITPPVTLTEKRIRPIKIGYINKTRLFKKYSIVAEYQQSIAGKSIKDISNPDEATIARNEKVSAIIGRANKQVKIYAEENGLDLVLQDAVWVSQGLDITNKIIDKF
jgi:Skp family chaperone for outer membrane proteins